jgi:hypothetical protein
MYGICPFEFSFLSCRRWSRRLTDWEAMVAVQAAAAAEEEEWGCIMVLVLVVGGNGSQPCRAFQKLELEKHNLAPSPLSFTQVKPS